MSHRNAVLTREVLARLPREELELRLRPLISERLNDADDDEYRRLAEALAHLGLEDVLAELVARAIESDDPHVREVAEDFGR